MVGVKTGRIENRKRKIGWKMSFFTGWLKKENRRESFPSRPIFFILPIWEENGKGQVLRNAFYTKCTLFTTWWLLPLLSNIALAYVFFGAMLPLFLFFWFARLPFFFFSAETLPFILFYFILFLFLSPGRAFLSSSFFSSSGNKVAFSFPLFFILLIFYGLGVSFFF